MATVSAGIASGLTSGGSRQNPGSFFNPSGNPAVEALMQQRGLAQYASRANAGVGSSIAGAVGGADANSISATGFNPNTGNTTPTYNNLNSLQNSSANTTVGNVATDAIAGVGGVAPQVAKSQEVYNHTKNH